MRAAAEARGINFRYPAPGVVQMSLNETVSEADLADIAAAFAEAASGARDGRRAGDGGAALPAACAGRRRS